jgi:hypothetical protein
MHSIISQNILYFYRQFIENICITFDFLFSYCIRNPSHLLLIAMVLLFVPMLYSPIRTDLKEHFLGVDRFTNIDIMKKYNKNDHNDQKLK